MSRGAGRTWDGHFRPVAPPPSLLGRVQRQEWSEMWERALRRLGYRPEEELAGYVPTRTAARWLGCSGQYLTRLAPTDHPRLRGVRRFRSLGAGHHGWRWNPWDLVYAGRGRT